jgi:hypothetical protein
VPDFFEVDRLVEELAKIYATACATAWFKIEKTRPTQSQYREKVVEYMRHFEGTLATFPDKPEAKTFRDHAKAALDTEIARVLSGQNKEVERRYKYFVDYG